jgi:hypothetical protein
MSAALVQKALEVVDPDFNKYSKGGEDKRWKCVNCRPYSPFTMALTLRRC